MTKKVATFLLAVTVAIAFAGCTTTDTASSGDVEVIVEETIVQGGDNVSSDNNVSSIPQQGSSTSTPSTTTTPYTPSTTTPQNTLPDIDFEWKSHPQDFKLIALTFDDGPSSKMSDYVTLLNAYEGAGTFFVNGNKIDSDYKYSLMQNAVNYGWDIGNHGDNHLVATIGGAGGSEASYDQIKADINNLTAKLEGNLKTRSGAPYKVNLYRPPNIKPTANTFKVCSEQKLAVIWLKHDALDWDQSKTYNDRHRVFKNGIGTWKDGDIVLCHETSAFSEDTYKILEELLPDFYRAGYRFCSISELMQMRGISIDQISGELNNVDGNRGMVTNIFDAVAAGKK